MLVAPLQPELVRKCDKKREQQGSNTTSLWLEQVTNLLRVRYSLFWTSGYLPFCELEKDDKAKEPWLPSFVCCFELPEHKEMSGRPNKSMQKCIPSCQEQKKIRT